MSFHVGTRSDSIGKGVKRILYLYVQPLLSSQDALLTLILAGCVNSSPCLPAAMSLPLSSCLS